MKKNFYITTTLPYVNSDPHVGFAMEIIRADIIARYKKSQGFDVFFNTGTDEHGTKIYRAALERGVPTQQYVDEYAQKFKDLKGLLGLSEDINFIRTTDAEHKKSAQAFWIKCKENGDIYKKAYKIKYCVGCELEKTESELVDGKCPLHPKQELETIEEENYFFKFSKYQKPLLDLYTKNPDFVVPDFRFNEIKAFVERGLEDFSISRLKTKMPWGVPVPDDSDHIMYVWFDALVNYISAIGWPSDMAKFEKYWPVTQYAGKDNLRQQSAMWQAMLMSAGLPPSKQIVINGFITGEGGIKMSKSIGNVINPVDVVREYGTDALRYYVARELSAFEDSPFTMEKFKSAYNANLANGLGNLVRRIMHMAVTNNISISFNDSIDMQHIFFDKDYEKKEFKQILEMYKFSMDNFRIKDATDTLWCRDIDGGIGWMDWFITKYEPYKEIKNDKEKGIKLIKYLLERLLNLSFLLEPIMPNISKKIRTALKDNTVPMLFPRE